MYKVGAALICREVVLHHGDEGGSYVTSLHKRRIEGRCSHVICIATEATKKKHAQHERQQHVWVQRKGKEIINNLALAVDFF